MKILTTTLKTLPGVLLAGALLAVGPVPAHAAAPLAGTQAPGYYRMMVGSAEVTAVSDGTVTIPLDELLTNTTPARLDGLLSRSHLGHDVETSINAYLVNTGTHLVLVDTGAGGLFGPGAGGRLLDNIRAAGYTPEQVDAVLITHIHGDHSGGLSAGGTALFPNATVYLDRHEADFWLDAANRPHAPENQRQHFDHAAVQFAPYRAAGRLKTFDGAQRILPGFSTRPAPGHTPGHTVYVLESGGKQLHFWGDLLHAKDVQFAAPDITIRFDVASPEAATRRKAAFADAARRGYLVAPAHTPFPGIGYVRAQGKAFDWLPVPYSALTVR